MSKLTILIAAIASVLVHASITEASGKAVGKSPPYDEKNPLTFWPPLACHKKWYDHRNQRSFPQAQFHCRDENTHQRKLLAERVAITDWKTCILWRMRGLVFEGATPVYRMNRGLRRSLLVFYSGLYSKGLGARQNKERKDLVEKLLSHSAKCAKVLERLVKAKLPSAQWGEFHDCIENAWKC